jgi:uncharacterized membrane protein YagU involved in acid resistance
MSILGRALAGAVAGTVATLTMSGTMAGAHRAHLLGEPPPRKITRAALRKVAPRAARDPVTVDAATIVTHLGFGASMGAVYALLARRPSLASGVLFGTAVWAVSYAGWAPALHVMPWPDRDRAGRPSSMLVSHWVYGATLAKTLRMLP